MAEDRFIRLPEVMSLVGMSRTTIYSYIQKGEFPAPMKFGMRISLWSTLEIQDWMTRCRKPPEESGLNGGGVRQ